MRNDVEDKIGSTIVARINAVQMSDAERQRALNALRDADLVVDGFMWMMKKIEQTGARLFLKPALKH